MITANANDIARITPHKNAAALFFPQTLCHASFKHSIFFLRSDSGFPPAVRFAADYIPYCKSKNLYEQLSACPYNNVRRARLHILCVENTPPKNKNSRISGCLFGELPQQSSAIQNSRTIAVISRTDAAAITIPENTQRQTKLVFGVVRTYFFRDLSLFEKFFSNQGEI